MKKILLQTIMILSKGFLYGLVFQMLVVNFTSVIQAKGQYKSIEEVEVTLSDKNLGVITFFDEVKRQTPFRFSYDKRSLKKSNDLIFSETKGTVEDFLIEASLQSNLNFRQFNNTIDVKMVNRGNHLKGPFFDPVTISGTVKDARGEPLPGATISVLGGNKGTVTGIDGTYSIEVETGVTLVFSYIGFQNQSYDIGNQTNIDVTLLEDESSLEEVVVVGYGTVNKRDLTSAISQVSGKEIESRFTSRIDEALQGKLAGVSVQQTSGLPGAAPVIRIRGTSSITEGNQPLWVVDGMPIEDANIIANINMSDAESVEVLKDAAAAAIYGSRASNGVVIVTTKKGKSGKPNISYNMRYGIQEPEKLVDFVSGPEHAEILVEWRSWRWESTGGDPNLPNASRPANMRIDPNWLTGDVPDHNIQDLLFQTATIQNHNVSLSGGSDNTTYFMSLDYMDQDGIAVGTSFERFSLRTNIESRVTDLITIGLNMAGSTSTQIDANSEGKDRNINVSLRNGALVDASDYYFLDNGFLFRNDYSFEYGLGNSSKSVYELNNLKQKFTRPQALINTHIDFNLIDGLVFKVAGYYRYNSLKFSDRRDAILGGGESSFFNFERISE